MTPCGKCGSLKNSDVLVAEGEGNVAESTLGPAKALRRKPKAKDGYMFWEHTGVCVI